MRREDAPENLTPENPWPLPFDLQKKGEGAERSKADVYVHHSLFRDAGVREGDRVMILVEDSERDPRASSLWID
ncbi:MAG: hypothetical protein RMK84_15175 [Oscillochloridaceae bacterium]|nr:hypothetical protein [Chloroflexaceae bacterium]MDW8391465.1 hypothetical protein [Oscillochloridaceae bacterium]